MRRAIALLLVLLLAVPSLSAGVGGDQARASGGSGGGPPVDSVGYLQTVEMADLLFEYKAGKNGQIGKYPEGTFAMPYVNITRFVYGDTKHLRVGQTIALSALAGVGGLLLLLSKSHTHYLSIYYKDTKEQDQVISFEVGKTAIRPVIESLELRTSKKVELEADAASSARAKP